MISVAGIAGAILAIVAWFGGPTLAGSLVEASLASAGFEGRNTTVEVTTDPPWDLLEGRADRVVIRSEDATVDQLHADRLELALSDADLSARGFSRVDGRLEGVTLGAGDGTSIRASSVDIAGPAGRVEATIRIDAAEVERVALSEVERQTGVSVGSTTLEEPDRITFGVLLFRVDGRFVVDAGGSLSLEVNLPGTPLVPLISDEAIDFRSVAVTGGQLVLTGMLNLPALDGG